LAGVSPPGIFASPPDARCFRTGARAYPPAVCEERATTREAKRAAARTVHCSEIRARLQLSSGAATKSIGSGGELDHFEFHNRWRSFLRAISSICRTARASRRIARRSPRVFSDRRPWPFVPQNSLLGDRKHSRRSASQFGVTRGGSDRSRRSLSRNCAPADCGTRNGPVRRLIRLIWSPHHCSIGSGRGFSGAVNCSGPPLVSPPASCSLLTDRWRVCSGAVRKHLASGGRRKIPGGGNTANCETPH